MQTLFIMSSTPEATCRQSRDLWYGRQKDQTCLTTAGVSVESVVRLEDPLLQFQKKWSCHGNMPPGS